MADSEPRGRGNGNGTLGNLESLTLAEIIQSLTLGRKTARITVTSGSRFGHIWIEEGQAKHARTGQLFGEFAFYEMVGWKTGQFLLEPDVRSETRSLDHDPMFLVMEGSRRIDEAKEEDAATKKFDVLETLPLEAGTGSPSPHLRLLPSRPAREPAAAPQAPPPPERSRRPLLLAGALVPLCTIGLLLGAKAMLEPRALPAPVPRPAPVVLPGDLPEPVVEMTPPEAAPEDSLDRAEAPPETPSSSPPRPSAAVPEPSAPASEPDPDPAPATSPAAGAPDATPAPVPELAPAMVVEEPAYLRISGKSSLRSGTLVVRVDGTQVYTRTLSASEGKTKRFFKRMVGRAGETFETVIAVEPGEHNVHAQVTVGDATKGYDSILTLDVDPGATHDLRLVAGRVVGRPLTLRED